LIPFLAMQGAAPQTKQQLQLHDIHLPEQVSNLPTAIGWWLLTAMLIIATLWFIRKFNRSKKLNQSRNHALLVLKNQANLSDAELISLLKWGAMQYYNRQHVAHLYGKSFQQFLTEQLPEKHQQEFSKRSKQAFLFQYQVNTEQKSEIDNKFNSKDITIPEAEKGNYPVSNTDCKSAVKLWLTHALPPKPKQKASSKINKKASKKHNNGDLAHD
jgi:hypothetical protein